MKQNRQTAITETLKWEGGYVNDPKDSGGATNYGITIADVRKYINPNATAEDVKKITKQQAIDVYANKYWKTPYYDCDKLASGVDFSVFDFGVNSGPSRAKQYLDKAIGGPDTETIIKLNDARLAFVNRIVESRPDQAKFLNGWTRRINGVKAKSLEMTKVKSPVTPETGVIGVGVGAGVYAFTIGHIPLLVAAGALILAAGIYVYLKNKR